MDVIVKNKEKQERLTLEDGKFLFSEAAIHSVSNQNGVVTLFVSGDFEVRGDGTDENDPWIVPIRNTVARKLKGKGKK